MTKFGNKTLPSSASVPVKSTKATTTNHGGATAYVRDAKSDLFLLGVMNFVGEDTFYEDASTRDNRFNALVAQVTNEDPSWVERFVPWLRNEANMRSASIVVACQYVKAGGPNARAVINSACSRADEPAEVLAYWIATFGKPIPSSVKRGTSDAARRLYNEYSLLKYDGNSKGFRFADVINLTHAKPSDDSQSLLFKHALDARYGNVTDVPEGLPMLSANYGVRAMDKTEAREMLLSDGETLKKAGMTWESLSGFGPMDVRAWEAAIPNMGYMALLRNLRNFEQAGISRAAMKAVTNRLSDPEQVAKSRQLPFRFWSAYKNAASSHWASALTDALDYSLKNLPTLGGKTLVLVDTSASMSSMGYSARGTISPVESAAIFGVALALKGEDVDLYGFGDGVFKHDIRAGGSVLPEVDRFVRRIGEAGHGTNIPGAMTQWDGHNRVVLITDMQTLGRYNRSELSSNVSRGYSFRSGYSTQMPPALHTAIPSHVPIFGFNLGGYGNTQIKPETNEFELGGLTDSTFKLITSVERRARGDWPF